MENNAFVVRFCRPVQERNHVLVNLLPKPPRESVAVFMLIRPSAVLRSALSATVLVSSLFFPVAQAQAPATATRYKTAKLIATINAQFINEASGIAVSRRNPGIVWLHNDSGDGPYLYAVDRRGRTKGVFLVRSASATDWEDMAYGPGPDGKGDFLYIGDIGDNHHRRTEYTVYRIPEPKVGAVPGSKTKPLPTDEPTVRLTFRYPDGSHNAETLLVHPRTGIIYVVTKEESGLSGVYRFPQEIGLLEETITLVKVATIRVPNEVHPYPNLVTGGAIAPDGKKLVLCTYASAYEMRLPFGAANFDAIWKTRLMPLPMPLMIQREAVCYETDGISLLTTSEKVPTPLYELTAAK